jgi:hypothetical protein
MQPGVSGKGRVGACERRAYACKGRGKISLIETHLVKMSDMLLSPTSSSEEHEESAHVSIELFFIMSWSPNRLLGRVLVSLESDGDPWRCFDGLEAHMSSRDAMRKSEWSWSIGWLLCLSDDRWTGGEGLDAPALIAVRISTRSLCSNSSTDELLEDESEADGLGQLGSIAAAP